MKALRTVILAAAAILLAVCSCQKSTGGDTPQPGPQPEPEPTAPSFKFIVNDLEFSPGQAAQISFKHEGVKITSSTIPQGWSVDLTLSDDEIFISAPSTKDGSFASGGIIKFTGKWNGKTLESNELRVNLGGICNQTDWELFCAGNVEDYIVDGKVSLNCDVHASKSIPSLDYPFDAHGHSITLDITQENSLGGLWGKVNFPVSNLNLSGSISSLASLTGNCAASLAAFCADGVMLESVNSNAEVLLDLQTQHISSCALPGLVASGKPSLKDCSFSGKFTVLNCDSGQDTSIFPAGATIDIPTGHFTLKQLKITTDEIGNSYILKTDKGSVLVFDGGNTNQVDHFLEIIKNDYGNKVDQWWFSHPHADHVGVFISTIPKSDRPAIGKVFYSKVPENITAVEAGSQATLLKRLTTYADAGGTVVDLRETGVRYDVDGVFIMVLAIATDEFPQLGSPYPSPINNASVILRVWDREKSVIFLGDAQELKGMQALEQYGPYMHCDYLQMGHHGNWTCGKTFYDAVDFKVALWPSPSWLYNCTASNAKGWDCWQYRKWVAAKGVKENHASCDGDWLLE